MLTRDMPLTLRLARLALLASLLVVMAYPVFWITSAALKTRTELLGNPFGLSSPTFDNLIGLWVTGDFPRFFLNSLIVSVVSVTGLTLFSAMAAFALSRQRLPYANMLFGFMMLGLLIPHEVLLIPVFRIAAEMGIRNSLLGPILVYLSWTPFGIFVLRAYFLTLPREMEEAACVDGCNLYGLFWRICMPLAAPALVTVAIFYFLWTWNNFLWPLILIQDPQWYTLQLGVLQYKSQFQVDYPKQLAALAISFWPPLLFYLVFRRRIQRGLTAGAIK